MIAKRFIILACTTMLSLCVPCGAQAEEPAVASRLVVPAYTAYTQPYSGVVWFTKEAGVTRWVDPEQSINWYGRFEKTGDIDIKLTLRLEAGAIRRYTLSLGDVSREAQATGQGLDTETVVDFGDFKIKGDGYHTIRLSCLSKKSEPLGNLSSLSLGGPAIISAHFNTKPRRNSSSVHLGYPVPKDIKISAFYCEATAIEDPRDTFYMAAGWRQGYMGMQVIGPDERRIIFSVWDAGAHQHERSADNSDQHAVLIKKGPDVVTKIFGAEGTGGHSHLKYKWKTGQAQKFLVTTEAAGEKAMIFSGYYFHPEQKKWVLLSSWRVANDDGELKGLHSFCENFWGSTGNERRHASFTNQWIRGADGKWAELTKASFTHDATGKDNRLDREGGSTDSSFYLANGGFEGKTTQYGTVFRREPTNHKPDIGGLADVEVAQ